MHLNERVLAVADTKFQKKYTKRNNFDAKRTKEEESAAILRGGPTPLGDDETFDRDVAAYAFNSPQANSNLNSLFMNTRAFNVSTNDYKLLKTQKTYEE